MKERVLVIYERESAYAASLSGYLSRNEEFPYRVAVFTNRDSLDSYLNQESADILLLGEDCPYEADDRVKQKILLTGEKTPDREEPWIFKYQSAGNIMREITAYAAAPSYLEEGDGPEINTVFATWGGQERNEYARALAEDLRQQGTVLYVNMDLFPAETETSGEEEKGMSEAVYYLKQSGEQSIWKIKGLIQEKDGIRELLPAHCSMDLLELTPEDVERLFRVFREMKELDYVVLEVGFYNAAMLEICRNSHIIYLITPAGKGYADSSEYFMGQLALMQRDGMERKVQVVSYGGAGDKTGNKTASVGEAGLFKGLER